MNLNIEGTGVIAELDQDHVRQVIQRMIETREDIYHFNNVFTFARDASKRNLFWVTYQGYHAGTIKIE